MKTFRAFDSMPGAVSPRSPSRRAAWALFRESINVELRCLTHGVLILNLNELRPK